jgi:4-amino-4-deoxy-L-arabinose transferase-like glycosyltransferase
MDSRAGGRAGDRDFRLSLVIPAWNEQDTIAQAIREADAALAAVTADYEILVVDDGSSDGTAAVVRAEAEANPHVRLLQHSHNQGYGAALRTGFGAAALDLVAFTDADCQFDLTELEYVLPLSRRFDVVCGYRIDRKDPVLRRFCSWGYNTLVKLLLGSAVHDIDCALKVYRREVLAELLPEGDHFFVNTEMLARAREQGRSVVEVGVHHRPRAAGQSKVSLRDVPRTLAELLPFWWTRSLFPGRDPERPKAGRWFWLGLLVLALVVGGLLFFNLSYPLIKPDESRYAEISREMLQSGDWIVPTYNHGPYYDKPPLFYWLTAGSFQVFGPSERAARMVPALAAFLTVLATFVFGTRIVGVRAAFLAALLLALTAGFIQCGRFIFLDSVFTLFLTLAGFTAYEAMCDRRLRWPWWLASAGCCGLALLTKGPVAFVLLVPPVAAHVWLNRSPARPRLIPWAAHVGVAAALAAPWFVAILLRDPGFAYHFFIEHHLSRFFAGQFHDSPVWFYVPVLLLGGLPWSLLVIPFVRFLCCRTRTVALMRTPALGFFLLWGTWCVLFFSLSRGKLAPYILPCTPPFALMLGCYLHRVLSQTRVTALFEAARNLVPRWAVVIIAGVWLVAGGLAWWKHLAGTAEYLIEASVCLAVIAVVVLWGRRMPVLAVWALCGVAVAAVIYEGSHELIPAWSYQRSPLTCSEEVSELLQDNTTAVAAYGHRWCSVPLARSEEDIPSFDTSEDLKRFLEGHRRNLLVTRHQTDRASLASAVPAGMEISQEVDTGETRVFVIQAVPGSPH